MKEVFKLKTFWVVFVLAMAAIFVMLLNAGRVYESTTSLLVIPKSTVAANNADQIMGNLSQLPLTLSFYQKMAADNSDVANDAVMELPDYKQKDFWDSKVRIERVGMSGVLKITVSDQDRYLAEVLSAEAARTLVSSVSLYYDIKTDLDVRIVDPTVTDYSAGAVDYILLLESAVGAFLAIFVIFFTSLNSFTGKKTIVPTRPNFFSRYENPFFSNKIDLDAPREKRETMNEKKLPEAVKKEWALPMEEKPYTDFMNINKTAASPANLPIAPANLPIAEEEFSSEDQPEMVMPEVPVEPQIEAQTAVTEELAAMEAEASNVKTEQEEASVAKAMAGDPAFAKATAGEKNTIAPITREATPEEVKARLNKLLSGKL